ncbi:hypothetical protein [Musicola paradisiaca]|uniref:Uncharacterized protein n=1 Tax=Musicola paradisiaca (strain Ech703) TaxID=579405 RepID=C6C7M5_MUSP7|nr:hypothetical protein [Musicola paradisiaca]ACS85967.1 hypothetical protein Dd703_2180 [Musicola paradisiaca Ech703]
MDLMKDSRRNVRQRNVCGGFFASLPVGGWLTSDLSSALLSRLLMKCDRARANNFFSLNNCYLGDSLRKKAGRMT